MALQKTITLPSGLEVVDAYHRVESVLLQSKGQLAFLVRSYFDPTKPFVTDQGMTCPYEITGDNPMKQAYLYLKTLPEFADAVDC